VLTCRSSALRSFGAAFTPFYRLFRRFKSDKASKIIQTEIWETITRRGIIGNVAMGLVPMVFYLTLSAVAFVLGILWQLLGGEM